MPNPSCAAWPPSSSAAARAANLCAGWSSPACWRNAARHRQRPQYHPQPQCGHRRLRGAAGSLQRASVMQRWQPTSQPCRVRASADHRVGVSPAPFLRFPLHGSPATAANAVDGHCASRLPNPWRPTANPQPPTRTFPPLPAALPDLTLPLARIARRFSSTRFWSLRRRGHNVIKLNDARSRSDGTATSNQVQSR